MERERKIKRAKEREKNEGRLGDLSPSLPSFFPAFARFIFRSPSTIWTPGTGYPFLSMFSNTKWEDRQCSLLITILPLLLQSCICSLLYKPSSCVNQGRLTIQNLTSWWLKRETKFVMFWKETEQIWRKILSLFQGKIQFRSILAGAYFVSFVNGVN